MIDDRQDRAAASPPARPRLRAVRSRAERDATDARRLIALRVGTASALHLRLVLLMTTETRAPKTSWCWWCRRATGFEDYDSQIVTLPDGSTGVICGRCVERADEGPDVPLDMTEGDDDDD